MLQSNEGKSVSTCSAGQRRANRANAKRSTGPRTEQGKRRSAKNAVTHGAFCTDAVLAGESEVEFARFRARLLGSAGLRPQDWLELSIADRYVLACWRMRRARAAERQAHHAIDGEINEAMQALVVGKGGPGAFYHPPGSREEQQLRPRADHGIRWPHLLLLREGDVQSAPVARTLAVGFSHPDGGACERLARHEHRLELAAHRALRELRQLRKETGVDASTLRACPFVEDAPEDDAPEDDANIEAGQGINPEQSQEEQGQQTAQDRVIASSADVTPDEAGSAPSNAPAQNEPNFTATRAGDGADAACARGSANVEVIAPSLVTGQRSVVRRGRNP